MSWFFSLSLSLFVICACNSSSFQAPRDLIKFQELKDFPPINYRLNHNKIFLWPKNMTVNQGSRALSLLKKIEELDRESLELKTKVEKVKSELIPIEDLIKKKKREENQKRIELKRKQKLKNQNEFDLLELESIKKEIEDLKQQIARLEQNPVRNLKVQFETEQSLIQKKFLDYFQEINQIIILFDPPPSTFIFQFQEQGRIFASILNWTVDPEYGSMDFSTDSKDGCPATIQNMQYEVKGGVFTFLVLVPFEQNCAQFKKKLSFRISRKKYDSLNKGVYFGGEILQETLQDDGTWDGISGVVELADRIN